MKDKTMVQYKKEILKRKFLFFLTQISLPLIAIVISAYFFYAGKEQRELTITGIQLTNLVETKTEVGNDVIVLYKGDSIHNTVRYAFEIENTGNRSITQQEVYRFNWVAPDGYQIIDASVINCNNGISPIDIQIIEPNTLKINITALNKKSINQISILCISKKQASFSNSYLDVVIAGCEVINRIDNYLLPISEPFWRQVFLGNFGMQVVKTIMYFLIAAIIIAVIAIIIFQISRIIDKKKVKKYIARLPLDKQNLKVKYPGYFKSTYETLSSLSQKELDVLKKLMQFFDKDKKLQIEIILDKVLSPEEKQIYVELFYKHKDNLNSIIAYSNVFYADQLIEFFKTGKISEPFDKYKMDDPDAEP